MRRRVTALETFYDSLAALDDSHETKQVVKALMLRVSAQPESAPMLPGKTIRVLKSRSGGALPALRLFYWMDDERVCLLYIEAYDELTG